MHLPTSIIRVSFAVEHRSRTLAFLTESSIRDRGRRRAGFRPITESVKAQTQPVYASYDIFLSHAKLDSEIVLGVYDFLVGAGYRVYCDWISDPLADRSEVTPAHASTIRSRMKSSSTMLVVDGPNAPQSKWMCWEIGWFDGHKQQVAVLPILPRSADPYRGREFLGLYPYITIDALGNMRVNRSVSRITGRFNEYGASGADEFGFSTWKSTAIDLRS